MIYKNKPNDVTQLNNTHCTNILQTSLFTVVTACILYVQSTHAKFDSLQFTYYDFKITETTACIITVNYRLNHTERITVYLTKYAKYVLHKNTGLHKTSLEFPCSVK